MVPSVGRIVQYRLPARWEGDERWRPAIMVNVFGKLANLSVFLDGMNDLDDKELDKLGVIRGSILSVGSRHEGETPDCWRWPPKV